jgi:hypothetical protein
MGASSLRNEVVESQKFKSDLLKWKLILAAALGAAALGLNSKDRMPALLTLVPFVCIYADIVCYHNDLRVHVIGRFLRTYNECEAYNESIAFWKRYEESCVQHRGVFGLENFAMYWATLLLSLLIATLPLVPSSIITVTSAAGPMCVMTGSLGLLGSAAIRMYFLASIESLETDQRKRTVSWRCGWLLLFMCGLSEAAGGILLKEGGTAQNPFATTTAIGLMFISGVAIIGTIIAMFILAARAKNSRNEGKPLGAGERGGS